MIIDIRLQNFRSYDDDSYEFGEGVNIIVGPNASGKTNLLEAIQVLCLGTSYRAKDRELVQFNSPWARLVGHTADSERTVKLEVKPDQEGVTKSFVINGQALSHLLLTKTAPVVLFEPEYLRLLTGSPERRRDFLDDLLEQTTFGYGKLRRQYRRAVAQRNALLKRGSSVAKSQIFAWNLRLSELGEQIVRYRSGLLMEFNTGITKTYRKLARSRLDISLEYDGISQKNDYGTRLLHTLEANFALDSARGFTSAGPHRDDIIVLIGGHKAQESASRGEIRTLLLALKILELELLEKVRGKRPILLLDDVFSELDGARRQALTKFLKNYQVFITTTDADVVIQHFMDKATIIPTTKN